MPASQTFSPAGSGCCCCRIIYETTSAIGTFHNYRKIPDTTLFPAPRGNEAGGTRYTAPPDLSASATNGIDFDTRHKFLFGCLISVTGAPLERRLVKYDDAWKNAVTVISMFSPYSIRCVAADWVNQRLFYTVTDGGSPALGVELRRCTYTGGDVTTLASHSESGGFASQRHVAYCRTNQKVYFTAAKSADRAAIYSINADGTGEALCVNHSSSSNLRCPEIDHVNSKLYYIEQEGFPSSPIFQYLKRCNLDGSNIETVVTSDAIAPPPTDNQFLLTDVQFCAKENRVWWAQDNASSEATNLLGGIFSANPDGSDRQMMLSRWMSDNADANHGPNFFRLGCGIELTGPNTKG